MGMGEKAHLFWDSCIFYAYFSNNTAAYDLSGVEQYIAEAKAGSVVIYTCSVALAEVVPSAFIGGKHGSFEEFLRDFRNAVRLVDLNPNVMLMAARLKDLPYRKTGGERKLGTGDAIMLASCIHLIENYGVAVDAFHTFDSGKKRGLDGGKGMPLLNYEEWCEGFDGSQKDLAQKVIDLKRCNPVHPTPSLLHVRHEVPADKEKHMTEESGVQEPVFHTDSETIYGANKATGKNGHDQKNEDSDDLDSSVAAPPTPPKTENIIQASAVQKN
ncbi:hypothetical protein DmGdi_27310 [Gluconobacter sp. Gdi]|nr:hypothetical protein DmGdi_27310 [Gluconobacter sp. Gdi]